MRPKGPTSRVSVASRVVNTKHDELRPAVSKSIASKDMGAQHIQQLEGSYTVLLYFTLYIIICSGTELLNDIDNTAVISCYGLMFMPYLKNLFGEEDRHIMFLISPISTYCYDLMKTVSGRSFNAVSLGVPSTWLPNWAHIIFIHSAESSVWYFINILLFHVQKLFNWFSKYVWYLVAHFCVSSCFHWWYEKRSSNYQVEHIPIMRAARTETLYLKLIK